MKALFTVVLAILCFGIQRLQATTEEEDEEIEGHNHSSSNDDYHENIPRVEPMAWPQAKVYYEISSGFEPKDREQILTMMQKIENASCVRFVAVTTQTIYMEIRYRPNERCGSFIGYRHNIPRIMDLQRDCLTEYGILHELMHALGFRHEHKREDRDHYVTVNRENIRPKDYRKNFAKRQNLEYIYYNMSYDYNSVTHYKPHDFAIDTSLPTIVAKNGRQIKANGLSMNDVRKINIYYKCHDIEDRTTLPFFADYVNLDTCEFKLTADSKPRYIRSHPDYGLSEYKNNMFCKWTIRGSDSKRVYLLMDAFGLEYNETCSHDFLEIYNSVPSDMNMKPDRGKWCGFYSEDMVWSSVSTLDLLHLHLRTDSSRTFAGFRLLYFTATIIEAASCGATMVAGDDVAFIKSHPLNQDHYCNDFSCSWTIVTGGEKHVKIMMFNFNLENGTDCKYDYLEIFDGHNNAGNKIGKYCGEKVKRVVQSNTHALHFKFNTDSSTINTGFWFAYFATI